MPSPRDRRHILITTNPTTEGYTPHRKRIEAAIPPAPANRQTHAATLQAALQEAQQ